ncbi:hypothetical protein BC830DRAFT_1157442 [Chytriomyces sp. MP71]|nr:hypothetical protein BC830DRAFT_1157442 [Chytriomyces sp. MP71]
MNTMELYKNEIHVLCSSTKRNNMISFQLVSLILLVASTASALPAAATTPAKNATSGSSGTSVSKPNTPSVVGYSLNVYFTSSCAANNNAFNVTGDLCISQIFAKNANGTYSPSTNKTSPFYATQVFQSLKFNRCPGSTASPPVAPTTKIPDRAKGLAGFMADLTSSSIDTYVTAVLPPYTDPYGPTSLSAKLTNVPVAWYNGAPAGTSNLSVQVKRGAQTPNATISSLNPMRGYVFGGSVSGLSASFVSSNATVGGSFVLSAADAKLATVAYDYYYLP